MEPHFQTTATMSRAIEGTKTPVALPHCCRSESAYARVHRRVVRSWIDGVAGDLAEVRNVVQKKYRVVEVLPVLGFVPRIGKKKRKKKVGDATQGRWV